MAQSDRPDPDGPGTFQRAYYLRTDRLGPRLWRDLRLAGYLARVALAWLVRGGRVRRAHRRALESGRSFYIDDLAERD